MQLAAANTALLVTVAKEKINEAGITSVLKELACNADNYWWFSHSFAERITRPIAAHAGLPKAVAGDRTALEKELRARKPLRAMLIVVGPQDAGKTTLMYRMRHNKYNEGITSTNGLEVGTCCRAAASAVECNSLALPWHLSNGFLTMLHARHISQAPSK